LQLREMISEQGISFKFPPNATFIRSDCRGFHLMVRVAAFCVVGTIYDSDSAKVASLLTGFGLRDSETRRLGVAEILTVATALIRLKMTGVLANGCRSA
jgi:hypothetical protein